jgi:hypothetical protein
LNLAYRWFCKLGIEDGVPDHSTFSKNRHGRFRESDAFRHVFESVVHRAIRAGLVGGDLPNRICNRHSFPRGRDDEDRLTADVIELARQYGRYGYRRVEIGRAHV